jgi:hypothetical protein
VFLSGSELVLVAQVPRAGDRWQQVHFNRDVAESFFRVAPGDSVHVELECVGPGGRVTSTVSRPLVFAERNRNCKLEFSFGAGVPYPEVSVPILVVVELDLRKFRYVALMPGSDGYDSMLALNESKPRLGRGMRRVITTLDEVELRWSACPIRGES